MTARMFRHRSLASAILLALGTAAFAPTATAQTGDDPNTRKAPASEETTTLSGITVTAQKREEQLQDVPIAVTALDAQALAGAGIKDIKELELLVPGLTVTSTQSEVQTTARIRGIGTVGDNPGLESSVGVVIDGVYRPRNGVGFGDLGTIKRIEVLKGPQGTVFGKNTSAGVINVLTREPYYGTSFEGELTFGNYGERGASVLFNTPFSDAAAFSIYGAKRQHDGYMGVRVGPGPRSETDDYTRDFYTLRAQLLLEPSDSFDLRFIADATRRDERCCTAVTIARENTAGLPFHAPTAVLGAMVGGDAVSPTVDPFARTAWSNRPTNQDIEDQGFSAEANWDMAGGTTLTSITALREWQAINALDFDFSSADLIYRNADPDESLIAFDTFSQELRFTGSSGSVDWMVGAFFLDEDLERNETYRIGQHYEPYLSTLIGGQVLGGLAAQLAPLGITVDTSHPELFISQLTGVPFGTGFAGLGTLDQYQQNARSLALFTNNTWHATDALDLTLGLRYTREDKTLDSHYTNPNGSAPCGSLLSDPGGHIAAALAARGVPLANLPPGVLEQLIGAVAPTLVGYTCLPWANVLHDGRDTHQDRDEKEWSGTFKADYRWSPQVMTYFSAARGYKAGGFNLDRVQSSNGLTSGTAGIMPVDDTSFPAEFVDSFELGAKTTWANGNLLLNATLFHQTYSDFQLNSFLGTSFVVRSIPEVVSKGIDTQLLWQTGIEGLMLRGGVMYADTQYGDDPLPDEGLVLLPGSRASFAPLWSNTASVSYQWDIGDTLMGQFNLSGKYMSDYNTGSDLDPQKLQEGFGVANLRIGMGARDGSWSVELWSENVTDEEYIQVGFDAPIQPGGWNAFLAPPRTYGATLRMNLY